MDKSTEFLDVPKCPLCDKAHRYPLTVLRSGYLYGGSQSLTTVDRKVRRLFICPTTQSKFEAFVTLKDDPKNKIVSIRVEAILRENS